MSKPTPSAEDIVLPIKRTTGETLEERLTSNAYNNILPARYLQKDADGELIEDQTALFERVAKNVALAEAVYEAAARDIEITVSPAQLKPDHPRRDELAEAVFGAGVTADDDVTTALSEANVNKFAFDTIVPELPPEIREHVTAIAEEFQDLMERLAFTPNSPTLMNAGGELQQLSACFVMSPDDDISNIHETAKKAAEVFQSGGGVGYGFWKLRPYGDRVGSTGGIASGPITFMRTYDQLCFPPQTKVLTPDGQKPIETLGVGDIVIDENGEQQAVLDTIERHIEEELIELTPERLNKPIRTTAEHPFKVIRDGDDQWVEAAELTEDDLLVLGHTVEENDLELDSTVDLSSVASGPLVVTDGGVSINREYYGAAKGRQPESIATEVPVDDFATIAGWYLAEGSVVYRRGIPNEVTFTLHHDEREAAKEIRTALESFDVPTREEPVPERNIRIIHVERSSFAQLIEGLFGTRANEKTVPSFLWAAPPSTQARVLEALFAGDGRLAKRGQSQRVQLQLANEEIIDFVFQAGLRCGVQFSRHHREPTDRLPVYWVSASVSTAIGTPLESLFDDVPEEFRVTDRTKQVNGQDVVAIDSIKSVPYEGAVHNLEVDNTQSYVAEDLVVHNCETIAQGGTRRGAQMGVMRVSHPDVIEFIHSKNKDVSLAHSLRLNDPDDYTYTTFSEALAEARELIDEEGRVPKHLRNAVEGHLSNFNISVGITDDFMDALEAGEEYTFTNPRTGDPHIATPETKEMYGRYGLDEYVEVGEALSVPAEIIWERIVEGAHENGEPGVVFLERINKEHSFDVDEHPDHQILATNPCVTGDTEIAVADGRGSVPIEILAKEGKPVPVYCYNESDDSVSVKMGREPRKTRINAEILEIETDGLVSLRCTPDHEIRTKSGFKTAEELQPGDRLEILDDGARERTTIDSSTQAPTTNHVVTSIEAVGRADVYNITVDTHHNFYCGINADDDVFVNVANCGEQPLEEYEACNLGHINLSTIAAEDAPDWRVWAARHEDDFASQPAAIEAFLEAAIDWEEFDRRIELSTRFLENVVTMSDFPVDDISDTVRRMRKIGLGIMGLAQLYIQLGMKYGSEASNEAARQLMTHINHHSKWVSHELANKRGVFTEWDDSKYADPIRYREWFEHQTGLDADEWADGFPIRNHNTTTIAPTGTTSMVANTTGGCEPIFNVAYYKNVTEDVQGEEMLVEFDDYFLRVLEANDIEVDTVKAEAKEQMAANEFDGIEGLTTVPDAIGELFVVTSELTPREHASVQCALQAGVDSSISKTVNAPNDATVDETREVFEYIYEHGGKGVTYYRDGTRSKQVLTTRADNADFASMDDGEAAQTLTDAIEDIFGDLQTFLSSESARAAFEDELETIVAPGAGRYAEKKPRPDQLHGVTQRIDTGYGKLYVTINEDPKSSEPFELFANTGHSGGFTNSFTDALAKTISIALRSGVDPYEIVDKLQGIRSPKVAWDKGEQINSIPDAFGTALRRYLEDEIDRAYPQQKHLTELEDADEEALPAETDEPDIEGDMADIIANGESPECPDCGSYSLYYAEGCKTCDSCGWSEC